MFYLLLENRFPGLDALVVARELDSPRACGYGFGFVEAGAERDRV